MRKFNLRGGVANIHEARFGGSQDRIIGANGEITASSREDLMLRLAEIAAAISSGQLETSSEEQEQTKISNRQLLEEAFADPAKWAELGAGLAAEIQERQLREGFMRQFLVRAEVEQSSIARIRVRTPNVMAVVSKGIGTHWPQFVRDKMITVDEFAVNANPEVDELEMYQNSGDILEDKYYEAVEAIYAAEDRTLVAMMRSTVGHYNPPTYFSGAYNHTVLQALRQGVTDWLLPARFLLLSNDLISDIMVGNEFSTWFDPISKWEIIQTGRIGNLLGLQIVTDGFREPSLKVLEPGEAFILSSPENNGAYTDRGPIVATPIDGATKGTNTKGWALKEFISITFANAKAVSYAKQI